jgi:hypothetical protein
LWWHPLRHARIENTDAEAEAMIRDFGVAAYYQARRMEHEASSRAMARDWARIALTIAQKTDRRVSPDTARRLARRATKDNLAVKPRRFMIQFASAAPDRGPTSLKEVAIDASDVSAAIIAAANLAWPPNTVGLRILGQEGREVFGLQKGERR